MSDAVLQSSDDPLVPMAGDPAADADHASRARVFPLTDLGNAERLVTHYGRDLHFVHAWNRWLIYNGQRWCEDRTGQSMDLAAKTARRIRAEAFQAADDELREAILSWARASEAYARLRAMVSLAQSQAGIPITTDEPDADDRLLNRANGVIDLNTGGLRPHQRDDLLTKQLPVA
jgi:putative DNA primase/helicase